MQKQMSCGLAYFWLHRIEIFYSYPFYGTRSSSSQVCVAYFTLDRGFFDCIKPGLMTWHCVSLNSLFQDTERSLTIWDSKGCIWDPAIPGLNKAAHRLDKFVPVVRGGIERWQNFTLFCLYERVRTPHKHMKNINVYGKYGCILDCELYWHF